MESRAWKTQGLPPCTWSRVILWVSASKQEGQIGREWTELWEWRVCSSEAASVQFGGARRMYLVVVVVGGLVTKSCPTLVIPWTEEPGRLQSMGFSRQEYWRELPFPSPGRKSSQPRNWTQVSCIVGRFFFFFFFFCRQILYQLSYKGSPEVKVWAWRPWDGKRKLWQRDWRGKGWEQDRFLLFLEVKGPRPVLKWNCIAWASWVIKLHGAAPLLKLF